MSASYSRVESSVEIVLAISGAFRVSLKKKRFFEFTIVRSAKDSTTDILRHAIVCWIVTPFMRISLLEFLWYCRSGKLAFYRKRTERIFSRQRQWQREWIPKRADQRATRWDVAAAESDFEDTERTCDARHETWNQYNTDESAKMSLRSIFFFFGLARFFSDNVNFVVARLLVLRGEYSPFNLWSALYEEHVTNLVSFHLL